MDETRVEIRIHWPESAPTLIYLPGLHGDWTLVGGFRAALAGRVRFIEFIYPRTLTWSLEDYAKAIETALAEHGVSEGWLLAESFGSQVAWAMLGRNSFRTTGVILAGGFVRHPAPPLVHLADRCAVGLPFGLFTKLLGLYGRAARLRYRHSPEALAGLDEFLARRTDLDRRAAKHRLRLIINNDFCPIASQTPTPVYALTGALDPVVAWRPVRRWLEQNCPSLKDFKVIRGADHTVLATGARPAAEQVLQWIGAGKGD